MHFGSKKVSSNYMRWIQALYNACSAQPWECSFFSFFSISTVPNQNFSRIYALRNFFSQFVQCTGKKSTKNKKKYNKRQAAQVRYMKLCYRRNLCAISWQLHRSACVIGAQMTHAKHDDIAKVYSRQHCQKTFTIKRIHNNTDWI